MMHLPKYRVFLLGAIVVLLAALAMTFGNQVAPVSSNPLIEQQAASQATAAGAAALQKARETGDPSYYGQADAAFAESLHHDAQNIDALVGQGLLALARHRFSDALALGQQAQGLAPDRALVLGVIGDAQIELGQYAAAAKTMQAMVNMRPDLSSYSRASYVRELNGDIDGAILLMQEAVTSGAPNAENGQWVRVQLGNLYFNKGDLTQAEHFYQEALARLPGYIYAEAGLAQVRAAQGRTDEAVQLYNQATAKIPLPLFLIALGDTEQAAGRPADAAKQYDLVRFEEKLFQANGVNSDLELAQFDADHGDAQAALAEARVAYTERPSVKGADTLAWALSQAGQQAEAGTTMQQALRLGSKDALFHYHAGMIAFRAGNMAQARAELQQALVINPYFSPIYAPVARQTLAQAEVK